MLRRSNEHVEHRADRTRTRRPVGVNIWNTSGFFVHDTTNKKERYDAASHLRSLSSGAYYQRRTDTSVTTGGKTYTVDNDGKCTTSDGGADQFPGR